MDSDESSGTEQNDWEKLLSASQNSQDTNIVSSANTSLLSPESLDFNSFSSLKNDDENADNYEEEIDETNELISKQVNDIFKNKCNLVEIEYQNKKLNNNLFIKFMVVTETFNGLLRFLYSSELKETNQLTRVNLYSLMRSIINVKDDDAKKKENNYYIGLLKTLIQLIIEGNYPFSNTKLFDIDFANLIFNDVTQPYISFSDKCFIIVKLFNMFSIDDSFNKDLASLLSQKSKFEDDLETKLNSANCLNDLDEDSKLNLLIRFIEIILANKKKYRNKLEMIEDRVLKAHEPKQLTFESLELRSLSHQAPLSKVYLNDINCFLNFWSFNSLSNCLIIEKQPFFLDDLNSDQDIYFNKSEFYLINDLDQLKFLLNVSNTQLSDSKLTNGLSNIIKKIETSPVSQTSQVDVKKNDALLQSIKLTSSFCLNSNIGKNRLRSRKVDLLTLYRTNEANDDSDDEFTFDFDPKRIDPLLKLTEYEAFYKYLLKFRNDLVISNFINYKIDVNDENLSIEFFSIDEDVKEFCDIEKSNQILSLSTPGFVQLLKRMCILLFKMINKISCLKSTFRNYNAGSAYNLSNNWVNLVESSESLSKLMFLMNIYYDNLNWSNSIKSYKCLVCGLNETNYAKRQEESYTAVMNSIKKKCSSCDTFFHLECLLKNKSSAEKQEADQEKTTVEKEPRQFDLVKNRSKKDSFTCFDCNYSIKKNEDDLAKEIFSKIEKKESLNSIVVNNKELRVRTVKAQYTQDSDTSLKAKKNTKNSNKAAGTNNEKTKRKRKKRYDDESNSEDDSSFAEEDRSYGPSKNKKIKHESKSSTSTSGNMNLRKRNAVNYNFDDDDN